LNIGVASLPEKGSNKSQKASFPMAVKPDGNIFSSDFHSKIYFRLSGYDISVEGLIPRNETETRLFKTAFERLECFKKPRPLRFFPSDAVINDIFLLLQSDFPSIYERIHCNFSGNSNLSYGEETDFALAVALLVSVFARYGAGRLSLSLTSGEQENILRGTVPLKWGRSIHEIIEKESHWLCFINLLAEASLWRFDLNSNGEILEFSLNMLVYNENDGFILREKKNSENLASLVRLAVQSLTEDTP